MEFICVDASGFEFGWIVMVAGLNDCAALVERYEPELKVFICLICRLGLYRGMWDINH